MAATIKATSPSKQTQRQLQADVQAHALATLETSIFWTMPREQLDGIRAGLASNPRLNPNLAAFVGEVIKRRFSN